MTTAGFVLTGGRSSRMGTDKALLEYKGAPLAVHVARAVAAAAGPVFLVGSPDRHGHLGITVIPDLRPGAGPLGGIETVLNCETADWNLVAACDMPALDVGWLRQLLQVAEANPHADCILPVSSRGPEPLCACYHKRALEPIRQALDAGTRKVTDALARLHVVHFSIDNEGSVMNVNTPADWLEVSGTR